MPQLKKGNPWLTAIHCNQSETDKYIKNSFVYKYVYMITLGALLLLRDDEDISDDDDDGGNRKEIIFPRNAVIK